MTQNGDEDIYDVDCELCKKAAKTINGSKSVKWQFKQANCSADVFLSVTVTNMKLCNSQTRRPHATVRIEEKRNTSDSGKARSISETKSESIQWNEHTQVDFYATIKRDLKVLGCKFIVEFNYSFSCPKAITTRATIQQPTKTTTASTQRSTTETTTATTTNKTSTTTTQPPPTTATTTTQPITTSVIHAIEADRTTVSSSAQHGVTSETSKNFTTGNAERKDVATRHRTDNNQPSCAVDRIFAILLGILFGATLLGLIYVIMRWRRQKEAQQGEVTSKNGAGLEIDNNDVAETRVNEIYNLQ